MSKPILTGALGDDLAAGVDDIGRTLRWDGTRDRIGDLTLWDLGPTDAAQRAVQDEAPGWVALTHTEIMVLRAAQQVGLWVGTDETRLVNNWICARAEDHAAIVVLRAVENW